MRRFTMVTLSFVLAITTMAAASHVKDLKMCSRADNIIGEYYIEQDGENSYVRCYKNPDGTYNIQMCHNKPDYDRYGNLKYNTKNPVKELRKIPLHMAVVVSGLKYNPEEKNWGDGSIHDPRNGIHATATVDFVDGGRYLRVRGSVLGIGKSLYWTVAEK